MKPAVRRLAALALAVAAVATRAAPRVTTELVVKLARKYDFGDDRARWDVVSKYAGAIEDYQVRDALTLAEVFRHEYWKQKLAKDLVGLLPPSLTVDEVRSYVRGLVPYKEDKFRFQLTGTLIPKLPPLDPGSMSQLTELFDHPYWKTKLLMESERFLKAELETREVVSLVRIVPHGEDKARWQAMTMLVPRWRVPAPAALVKSLEVFDHVYWKQKAVVQLSMRWFQQGLSVGDVISLVRVVPWGEDKDRYGFTMRLLPQIRDLSLEHTDALEQLFSHDYWKQKLLEEALPHMGL